MLQTDELMSVTSRKAAAEVRVVVAVASLREAQRLIEEAAKALSGVNGLAREWRRLDKLHEQVTRAFYDVRGRADTLALKDRLVLDHEPDSEEAQWTALWRGRL
jgi:hypothetical protein